MARGRAQPAFRLLHVEDDFLDQEILERTLAKGEFRFEISTCSYLQAGVELLREAEFDVLVLDLTLPDSFGIDTISRMLEEFSSIPLIVMTGSDENGIAEEALQLGVRSFLVKGQASEDEVRHAISAASQQPEQSSTAGV